MGLYDGLEEIPGNTTPTPAPRAPKPPPGLYDDLQLAPVDTAQPKEASGAIQSLQAGIQGSALGLAWRGKLPDLVINPEHASWWERALSGVGQVGAELPLMIGGAIAGAPAGAAIGTAAGPAGTAAGGLLGAGFGMGAVPAAIRQSLIEAYKSGEVTTSADFWNAIREVATQTVKEGAINAVGMGAGGLAARTVGKAIAPAITQSISVPTATAAIGGADLAAQIATMTTMPAALQGRLPDLQEIADAAVLVGGLHLAGVAAARITSTYIRTGKTPAEQVADAQRDPEIAHDLTNPPVAPEPEYVPPRREEMLKVQENLFTETARLNEMQAKADAAPLSDAERLEFNALKSKVLDLEGQLKTGAPTMARTPIYTADQFLEARTLADARSADLAARAEVGQLTDAERAERVFLNNSTENPAALARHFGIEPQVEVRPTPEQMQASADKIYEDVLRQVKDADEARKAAGSEPLGDDHAQAVAALVRARIRTRAERLGVLPESLYNERPVKIADEAGEIPVPAEVQTIPTEIPQAAGPELDLFGEPIQIQPTMPERMQVENLATQEVPLANLILSKEVPQFKMQANSAGVVQALGGRFDRTGVGPIQVWERLNGTLEVISGRHRLDLARRSGEETIPAQIHREADGFTARKAATLDAQLNIREEQGSVADYAQYFKDAGIDKATADELGLLARAKGRTGFAISRDASPDLLAAHRAGKLTDEAALSISTAAPGSARLQALGIAAVNDGKSILYATNLMRSVDLMAAERMAAGQQGDIFGFDDSALREASAMAKKASSKQRQISEQIAAVSGASKRPELARKMGVNVEDPAAVQAKILELKNEQYLWDNWPLYPELVAKLRGETLKQDAVAKAQPSAWADAPRDEGDYYTTGEIIRLEHSPYFSDGRVIASSRTTPNPNEFPPVGSWRIHEHAGLYGRDIEQLVSIPLDKLLLTELDSQGKLDPAKRGDDERYAEWIKEGKRAPPINVLQTEEGRLNVIDGHRRALAAKAAGKTEIEAWVNFSVPLPDGGTYGSKPGGKKIKTGMTFEMLMGDVDNLYMNERMKLFQDEFPMLPETPAEGDARDRDATAAAVRETNGITPAVLYQSIRDTWYKSALGEAITNLNMKAAPAKGWIDALKGLQSKGVKPDEIKWSGIEEWLQLQAEPVPVYEKGYGIIEERRYGDGDWEQVDDLAMYSRTAEEAQAKITPEFEERSRALMDPRDRREADVRFVVKEYDGLDFGKTVTPKITKEQVADYLANNGVKVEEVMLGGKEAPNLGAREIADEVDILKRNGWEIDQNPEDSTQIAFIDPAEGDYVDAATIHGWVTDDPNLAAVARAASNIERYWLQGERDAPMTKFGTYQLPGGENYRELLLTLPEKPAATSTARMDRVVALRQEWETLRQERDALPAEGAADRWGELSRQIRNNETQQRLAEKEAGAITQKFQSSHFDQPNILAHVRFNERTDADGKKVLFIEEFQSDWAQKGKKEGFANPDAPRQIKEMEKQYETLNIERRAALDAAEALPGEGGPEFVALLERADAILKEQADLLKQMNQFADKSKGTIPAAPFVGKTDAWVSLALKRMISYAAQNGFDRVAWTRGEQQVERYTGALRKAVDVIEWKKTPEGVQLVGYKGNGQSAATPQVVREARAAIRDNDNLGFDTPNEALASIWDARADWEERWQVDTPENVRAIRDYIDDRKRLSPRTKVVDTTEKEDALSDAIGKAMAEKIISDPNQSGTIEGDGIRIDSTGMAGFYDRIVPKVANEVLKKLGGGKVGEIKIGETGDIFEKYDLQEDANSGRWMLIDRETNKRVEDSPTFRRGADAEEWARNHMPAQNQNGFDITPSMVEKATAGLPLFQKQTDQLHRGSYDIAENLVTIMKGADKSTVVHELGHSWLEEMKADAMREGVPDQIRADWEMLRQELNIGKDGEISRASHEQFARSIERYLADGEAPSVELRGVFERFKQWLLDIYRDLRNLNVEINPELRSVMDRMLATDEEIAAAREMDIPRAYVPEAIAAKAEAMYPSQPPKRKIEPGFQAEQISMQPFADEIPHGPGEAPDTSRINLDYVNGPDDLKLLMARMAEVDQANIQQHRGGTDGVKSWEEGNREQAKYLNDVLGGDEDTLKILTDRSVNDKGPDVRLGILKKMAVAAAADSAKRRDIILEKGHDATVREQLEYMGSIERARMIQAEFLGERASVARALNALKDTTEGTGEIGRMLEAIGVGDTLFQSGRTPAEEQAYMKAKLDEILQNYKGKSVLDIAKLHKEIGTLKGTFKFSKEVTKATTWEMVIEGWRSGLLSGPVTHTTNLVGTEAFHVMRPAVDALAAIIGMARGASPGMGESDRASMSESVARLTGMLGGMQDGLKVAIATFKLDDPTGKTEAYRTAIPGRAGELIRIPLRLMGAEDALITTMYTRGELRTLAIRTAFDENLNPGTREFADRVQQLVDKPSDEMMVKAEEAATRMTFNAPLGEKGVALQGFVNKWNLQWMMPFIRTPINIAKELARMSPFAPIVGEWRADIAKGGVARDKALAEMALGSGIMAITAAYAFAGNISGAGSPDPGKNRGKAGVWQPYSILIGDTWYEYARIQPTGTLMGLAADMAAVWDHMTDEEKDKVPKMLSAAFAQAVTNQTFLQGITNVVNAMSDPARFGPRFFQQMAGSMVPNIIGQPTTMADPVVREVNSALEAIQARIPGMRQDLLPKRDWLGAPVETKERVGVVLPSRMQEVSKDKVRLEAARLDISMAAPPKKTHIGKGTGKLGDVELTPEEQDKFEQIGGQFAHGILQNIVAAPGYDQMPDMVKRKIFSNVLTAAHRVAAVQAMPMEKRNAYLQEITEKVQEQLAPGEPQ